MFDDAPIVERGCHTMSPARNIQAVAIPMYSLERSRHASPKLLNSKTRSYIATTRGTTAIDSLLDIPQRHDATAAACQTPFRAAPRALMAQYSVSRKKKPIIDSVRSVT